MNPSEAYYKIKRSLLLFTGCSLLAVFAGFKLSSAEQRISVLPFQLERPEFLSTIFAILVAFFLFQFFIQWAAQPAEVQVNRFHRIDFLSTFATGVIAIIIYAIDTIRSLNILPKFIISFDSHWISVVGIILAIIATIITTSSAKRAAEFFGRKLKASARYEERNLTQMLTTQAWTLTFNPESPKGKKLITFKENGQIGEGQNDNEHTWRFESELLEILNSKNEIFSRFKYNATKRIFEHTNDTDTRSIRSQTIVPLT